jgi:hypothetical protein
MNMHWSSFWSTCCSEWSGNKQCDAVSKWILAHVHSLAIYIIYVCVYICIYIHLYCTH